MKGKMTLKEQLKQAIMINKGYSVIWNSDLENILEALLRVTNRKVNLNKKGKS